MNFEAAVERVQGRFADPGVEPYTEPAREYVRNRLRLTEARQVDELVQRYASAELAGQPIGRAATGWAIPPLAVLLERPLRKMRPPDVEALRDAVIVTVAYGYLLGSIAEVAQKVEVEVREPRALWAFWIPRIHSPFLREALPQHDYDLFTGRAAHMFGQLLRQLPVGRKARGTRATMVGMSYGAAGVILRAAQTSRIAAELILSPGPEVRARWPDAWPIEQFPVR